MPQALVTGASDGIGLEFCKILAERGYDLILVARRQQLLDAASRQLTVDYGVRCEVIVGDLSLPKAAQKLFDNTQERDLRVDFLINNAGLLQNGFFTDIDLQRQQQMMAVNMLALTSLTHLYANDMLARGGGYILNVSSLAAATPIPNQNVYAASKAYVLAFSQALANELKVVNSGISVTALCPGFTATKMMDNPDQGARLSIPSMLLQPAREVAQQGIDACLAGRSMWVPGLANRLTRWVAAVLPNGLLLPAVGRFYRKNMR
jgi:short-subunit dehydrogenase